MKKFTYSILLTLFAIFSIVGCGGGGDISDGTNPTITITGESTIIINKGEAYSDDGATAVDSNGNQLTIITTGSVDINVVGIYSITYSAVDSSGLSSTKVRTVQVKDNANSTNSTNPTITITGSSTTTIIKGEAYIDKGATAVDSDGASIIVVTSSNNVDTSLAGDYSVIYSATDAQGNNSTATRVVKVIDSANCVDLGIVTYSVDTTLDASCYIASQIKVEVNKLLTISEGTTIFFKSSGYIEVNGALKAIGTTANPITFTGTTKSAGFWQGIQFKNAVDDRNELNNTIIDYAGSWGNGALYTSDSTKLKVSNTLIQNSETNGFYFSKETDLVKFKNVTSTNNAEMAGSIGVKALPAFDDTSDFTGNLGNDYLEVRSSEVTTDQIWNRLTVPVYVNRYISINENKLVTINEGATFAFASSGYLEINGALKAIGTTTNPITFTGATKSAGFWQGIQFKNAVDDRNELNNTIIDYAGSWGNGALYTSDSTKLKVSNTLIQNSETNGFYFSKETDLVKFKNVTSTNNAEMAGSIGVKALPAFDNTSDFTGNLANDYLEVRSSIVTTDQIWNRLSVPVYVNRYISINESKLVTINEGATFAFASSGYLEVKGALKAIGTSTNPITFTGATKSSGFWQSIQFQNAVDDRNEIAYSTIEYAGSWGSGNVYLDEYTVLNIHNTTIQNGSNNGISISGCYTSLTNRDNIFIDNALSDVYNSSNCN